jgi:hypothetical protein
MAKDFAAGVLEADSVLLLVDNYNDAKQYREGALQRIKSQKR